MNSNGIFLNTEMKNRQRNVCFSLRFGVNNFLSRPLAIVYRNLAAACRTSSLTVAEDEPAVITRCGGQVEPVDVTAVEAESSPSMSPLWEPRRARCYAVEAESSPLLRCGSRRRGDSEFLPLCEDEENVAVARENCRVEFLLCSSGAGQDTALLFRSLKDRRK